VIDFRFKRFKGYSLSFSWEANIKAMYGATPAIWDHTVLFAIWHRWKCPT